MSTVLDYLLMYLIIMNNLWIDTNIIKSAVPSGHGFSITFA